MSKFNEIIGRSSSLGGTTPENRSAKELLCCTPCSDSFMVEITIAYPHTARFLRLNSDKQKKLIGSIFRDTIASIPLEYHDKSKVCFEYTKSGQIHAHGYLITKPFKHFPIGVISDMAKACLNEMPKKYCNFRDHCMNPDWIVYRDAPVKLKYQLPTVDQAQEWIAYCEKLQ